MTIGIDLEGGDTPPLELYTEILKDLSPRKNQSKICFYGSVETVGVCRNIGSLSTFSFKTSSQIVEMDDLPLQVVRKKLDSSMAQGLRDLRDRSIQALISVANTGALIAFSHSLLEYLPCIKRSALMIDLPSSGKGVTLLDVGASVNYTPQSLEQFTKAGLSYHHAIHQKPIIKYALFD